jgi:ribosomal protein L37AE/L43A
MGVLAERGTSETRTPMSERATPYYCPFCGDEDLRPTEEDKGWLCAACRRVFTVNFLGIRLPEGAK